MSSSTRSAMYYLHDSVYIVSNFWSVIFFFFIYKRKEEGKIASKAMSASKILGTLKSIRDPGMF